MPRNELADVLRGGMSPRLKRDLFRAMEKALQDMSDGQPVDVGPVLRNSQALGEAERLASQYATPEEKAATGGKRELLFDTERQDAVTEAPELLSSTEQQAKADQERQLAFEENLVQEVEAAVQRGDIPEEELAALRDNKLETERAKEFDERGQAVLECVWQVAQ